MRINKRYYIYLSDFPTGSVVSNLPANAGNSISIPGSGTSPENGNDNPLQYSCLGNPMDRGAWQATVHGGLKESDTTDQLTRLYLPGNLAS